MALTSDRLIAFLREMLGLSDVTEASPLFSDGALDSVGMMTLIAFVEEQAGIEVRTDEVTLGNFDTPARIVAFAGAVR